MRMMCPEGAVQLVWRSLLEMVAWWTQLEEPGSRRMQEVRVALNQPPQITILPPARRSAGVTVQQHESLSSYLLCGDI